MTTTVKGLGLGVDAIRVAQHVTGSDITVTIDVAEAVIPALIHAAAGPDSALLIGALHGARGDRAAAVRALLAVPAVRDALRVTLPAEDALTVIGRLVDAVYAPRCGVPGPAGACTAVMPCEVHP